MSESLLHPDFDDDRSACPKCGGDMEWADCWMIDCEGGWYDLSEEDPVNYGPGDMARCSNCDGEGGWLYCPDCEKKSPVSESGNAE
jgi:hypothetical protein